MFLRALERAAEEMGNMISKFFFKFSYLINYNSYI